MINCTIYFTETGLAVIYHVILIYPISQIFVDNITVQFTTDVQQGYATIVVRYIQITFFFLYRGCMITSDQLSGHRRERTACFNVQQERGPHCQQRSGIIHLSSRLVLLLCRLSTRVLPRTLCFRYVTFT